MTDNTHAIYRIDVEMQALGIILVLVSIGTVVGPIGAVVIMYQDDLSALVITPQIRSLMNGNGIMANNTNSYTGSDGEGGGLDLSGFQLPSLVDSQVDVVARTFSVTVNVTNPLNYDLTLNNISLTVQCTQHHFQLGTTDLANPVTIGAGQSALVTVLGTWTSAATNHVLSDHPDAATIDVEAVDAAIDLNGIVVESSKPIHIGNIPIR